MRSWKAQPAPLQCVQEEKSIVHVKSARHQMETQLLLQRNPTYVPKSGSFGRKLNHRCFVDSTGEHHPHLQWYQLLMGILVLQLAPQCCRVATDRARPPASPLTDTSNAKKGLYRVMSPNRKRKHTDERVVLETTLMQKPIFYSNFKCTICLHAFWC